MKIHDDLIILTKNIGNETWDAKPSTFAFLPHISMIKLDSSVIDQVLNTLKNAESKWSFVATALEVSKEVKVRGEHVGFNRDTVIYLT
ncbi:hypothetical protein A2619_02820 [candidate division WWE3 bacterium RIFOXYD1_FULL_39_9]|nr:MAG: hypothetical protein A2619_02820 [candidate division WWE3 bacterium RIFOXYD1_FULL_39_9]